MPDSLAGLVVRMHEAERRLSLAEAKGEKVTVLDERVSNLSNALHELSDEVAALRRAILTASLSFAISALLIAGTFYVLFK